MLVESMAGQHSTRAYADVQCSLISTSAVPTEWHDQEGRVDPKIKEDMLKFVRVSTSRHNFEQYRRGSRLPHRQRLACTDERSTPCAPYLAAPDHIHPISYLVFKNQDRCACVYVCLCVCVRVCACVCGSFDHVTSDHSFHLRLAPGLK